MHYPLIEEISKLFYKTNKPFWLAGGYSLDLLIGRKTREHEDLYFIVRRADQLDFQNILEGWDLQAVDPPGSGSLFPWKTENALMVLNPEIQLLYKSRS
jgi:hypothetical protein